VGKLAFSGFQFPILPTSIPNLFFTLPPFHPQFFIFHSVLLFFLFLFPPTLYAVYSVQQRNMKSISCQVIRVPKISKQLSEARDFRKRKPPLLCSISGYSSVCELHIARFKTRRGIAQSVEWLG
jgi:hypothetical protein